ncbi:SMI1/KNR4 family protein [Kribbella ginsengisoli]|uniref:SMI1/KNR4 family protein n=1 Tax=Kribbella ginsengisoli TaxID=363865 RepID=UPI0031E3ACD9
MNLDGFFASYRPWLQGVAPSLAGALRGPAADAELGRYEEAVGVELPGELRELWKVHDGESGAEPSGGTIGGLLFLGVERSLKQWMMWSSLRAETGDAEMRELSSCSESFPPGAVQLEYSVAGWLSVLKVSMDANYIGLDLAPGPGGVRGQVINFGRDEDRKVVIARSMTDLLGFIASEADRGEFVVSSVQPGGQPILAHRRGHLISVLCELAESRGPLG